MSKYRFISIPVILALVLSLGVGLAPPPAVADYGGGGTYPVMHPDRDTLREWILAYEAAPEAYIDTDIAHEYSSPGSYTVLPLLTYTPAARNQGSCGNCWVWAGTGILGIALNEQRAIADRLSIQYLDSCWTGIPWACCGGFIDWFADFYDPVPGTGMCIPWGNTNAAFADAAETCATGPSSVTCGSISTTPNYPITNCDDVSIATHGVGQATAITNIKNILHQDRGVWFAFYLCNNTQWNAFRSFWNTGLATDLWDPDPYCDCTWNPAPGEGGGHAVLCVGYNDDDADPSNHYWIMLNSWGTTANRPDGLFRMKMNIDYDCTFDDPPYIYWSHYWETLDVTFAEADLEVTEKYETWVDPVAGTYEVTYTVTNTGNILAPASTTNVNIDGGAVADDDFACPALQPGEFDTNTVGPYTLTAPSDTINVCADVDNDVPESNEGNNCLQNDFGEVMEFGDAPVPYPSTLALGGVRHLPTDTEWLGLGNEGKDYEPDARVPDLDLPYDDGLFLANIVAGDPAATVTFEATASTPSDLYVNILLDLNGDGDWLDTIGAQSEHVVQNQLIATTDPVNGDTFVSTPFSTVGAAAGPTWLRITLTRIQITPPWDGTMAGAGGEPLSSGETEDYEIDIIAEYGDAPDPPYPSTFASDGARHTYTDTEFLGLASEGDGKDSEPDADVPNADLYDDGLVTTTVTAGMLAETVTFQITDYLWQSLDVVVNILIDLNVDGDWADAGEHVVVNQPITTTALEQTVVSNPFITVGATPGPTWLRITLTRSDLVAGPWDGTMTGYAAMTPFEYGETEDHPITIGPPPEVPLPGVTICTPPVFELTLRPGESATEIKVVELATMPIPEVDIVFAFDLTGSMAPSIAAAQAQAINIMTALTALIPDARFAVMSYMDYPEYYDYCGYAAQYGDLASGDYAYRLDQALTADTAAVAAAITGLVLGFGSDNPEDYARIMYESYAELIGEPNLTEGVLGYRPGAKKILINFADNVPHDCDLNEGVPGKVGTWSQGGDPGRDEIMGNADDLDLQAVLAAMASNGVTLLEVHCSSSDLDYWAHWAGLTGGAVFEVTDPSGIAAAVYALVETEVSVIELLTIHVQPADYAGWVTWLPLQYTDVSGGETKTFSIIYTVPDDIPSGDYVFEVKVIADSVIICIQIVTIHVIAEEVAPARIIVRNLLIQPAQAYPGQQVTISADVVNQGGIRGSKNIELVINGQAEQAIRVGVDPGAAQHITFTTSKTVPGTYEVYIEGQASAFNVLLRPHVTSTGAFEGLGTGAVIAIVVIGVIFLVGIIIVFIRVRRPS